MLHGGCLCGAVKYVVDGTPLLMENCHCSMCRKFHGAAYATISGVRRRDFRWLCGEDSLKAYTASNGTTRRFCRHCGSSLTFHTPAADPDLIEITLRSLQVSLTALVIASAIALPLGTWLAIRRVRFRRTAIAVLNSLMGLPPVVVGLIVYLLLSRAGPFGVLGLLFTPTLMFFPEEVPEGVTAPQAAVAQMPGAFGKMTTLSMFRWVVEKGYEGDEPFQKYLARMIGQ